RAMERPRPTPPVSRFREFSIRKNGVKTCSLALSGIPGPSSETVISTLSACLSTLTCARSAAVADLLPFRKGDVMTEFSEIVAETFHESREVHRPRAFCGCIFASECESRLCHRLDLGNCGEHFLADVLVGHEFCTQAERG